MSGPRAVEGGVRLVVRAKPKSSREGVDVTIDDDGAWTVVVRVNAPPVDGKANERIIEVMAKTLAVPKRAITIARGDTSKDKDLMIAGIDVDTCSAKLR